MSSAGDALVRPATLADARAMAEVHVLSARTFYREIVPDDRHSPDLEDRLAMWLRLIDDAAGWSFVVTDAEAIIGVCHAGPARDDDVPPRAGEILIMYMHPDYVGLGISQRLFSETVARLRDDRYRSAVLWVIENNPRARRFYERQGWSLDPSALPRQIGPYEDVREVRYRIDLGGGGAVRTIVGTG